MRLKISCVLAKYVIDQGFIKNTKWELVETCFGGKAWYLKFQESISAKSSDCVIVDAGVII
jgi:hypothetical protein